MRVLRRALIPSRSIARGIGRVQHIERFSELGHELGMIGGDALEVHRVPAATAAAAVEHDLLDLGGPPAELI